MIITIQNCNTCFGFSFRYFINECCPRMTRKHEWYSGVSSSLMRISLLLLIAKFVSLTPTFCYINGSFVLVLSTEYYQPKVNTSIVFSFRILILERWADNCGDAMSGCIMLRFQLQTLFFRHLKLNKNIQVPSYSDFRLVFDIV